MTEKTQFSIVELELGIPGFGMVSNFTFSSKDLVETVVPLRLQGTIQVMTLGDSTLDESASNQAQFAAMKRINDSSYTMGVMLSVLGQTPESLMEDPAPLNLQLQVAFGNNTSALVVPNAIVTGVTITSVALADDVVASASPATATASAWTCSYCDAPGLTGKFCPNCGAPRS